MKITLLIVGAIILIVGIYFNIPYSRLRVKFKKYLLESEKNTNANIKEGKHELEDLPICIQNFYRYTGLMKNINSRHVNLNFKNVDFVNIDMKKTLKIDYYEHIFGEIPSRFAFIDSSLFTIPFQGLDSFICGKGAMEGVVAKNITLFNEVGEEMDKAALVTWLAEIIFMPSQLLSGDIEIKEIDKNKVNVSLTYKEITVSGIYKFLDNGELVEFTTDDRAISKNGGFEYKKWSALFEDYRDKDGLLLPNRFKAKWHFDKEDLTYFDGNKIEYKFF